jgi:predicted RNA binding protein YcfA (HicA-like mRNA interferase family)
MAISSERIIGILEENGFTLCRVKGSHHHYKKEGVLGLVTVPHPKRDIPPGTVRSIERQSGIRIRP